MKNVTGYDLVKLMAGSHGTLGVLSEVAFKVLPMPEAGATVIVHGLDTEKASAAMSAALTSPYDVNAAAHLPSRAKHAARTCIRVEGFEGSVKYRSGQLKDLLARFGDVTIEADPANSQKLWQHVRDAEAVAAGKGDVWRISVKPSDAPGLASALGDDAQLQFDWGGGLVWACMPQGSDVRTAMHAIAGHATLVRSGDATAKQLGVFHPEPAPLASISAGLRSRFDPHGILNPGRMG